MPKGHKGRVVLTTHELRLRARRAQAAVQESRLALRSTVERTHATVSHSHELQREIHVIQAKIKKLADTRPTLKQIKDNPLHVLPCADNCVEERCEHYRDCQSLVLMYKFLMETDPDPTTIAWLYHLRNAAIEGWQKKGIFRGCMFKIPHLSTEDAYKHIQLLTKAEPHNNFYWYPCRYAPADQPHYHVAHTKASRASLMRRNESLLG